MSTAVAGTHEELKEVHMDGKTFQQTFHVKDAAVIIATHGGHTVDASDIQILAG